MQASLGPIRSLFWGTGWRRYHWGVTRKPLTINAPPDSPYISGAKQLGEQLPPMVSLPQNMPRVFDAPDHPASLGRTRWGLVFSLIRPYKGTMFWSTVTSTGMRLSGVALPLIMGKIIDSGLAQGWGPHLYWWTGILVAMTLLLGLFWAADPVLNALLADRVQAQLRLSVGGKAIVNGMALRRNFSSGDVITVSTDDAGEIATLVMFIPATIASIITILVSGWAMIRSSVLLGLLVILVMPLAILAVTALAKPMKHRQFRARKARADLATTANDAVLGLRILRGVGGESLFYREYLRQSAHTRELGVKVVSIVAVMNTLRIAVPAVFQTLIVAVGAWLVYTGQLTAGTLLAFFGMTTFLQAATNTLVTAANFTVSGMVGARRTRSILDTPALFPKADATISNAPINVTSDEPVAATSANLNSPAISVPTSTSPAVVSPNFAELPLSDPASGLVLRPGRIAALVGPSMAQADEVAQHLAFLDPESVAQIGEVKLSSLPLLKVRQSVLYSHGEADLFAGSLRSAILGNDAVVPPPMAAEEAMAWYQILQSPNQDQVRLPDFQSTVRDDELTQLLRLTMSSDILGSLGGTLDGEVAEKGRNLSGGQRQRLALARAFARNSPILILSEPTSALDANTEGAIGDNLYNLRGGQTTLLVTSSPLLLRHCDDVMVLDHSGRVLGTGTYKDLSDRENDSELAMAFRDAVDRAGGDAK